MTNQIITLGFVSLNRLITQGFSMPAILKIRIRGKDANMTQRGEDVMLLRLKGKDANMTQKGEDVMLLRLKGKDANMTQKGEDA